MSLRYRNNSGEETIIAGLTPGGDIEAGAVATRSGTISSFDLNAGASITKTITFDTAMPDTDYLVDINIPNTSRLNYRIYNKTANGFTIDFMNISDGAGGSSVDWYVWKTYTVQHAQQNAESIATLEAMVPAGAGAGNKLVTASQLTNTTSPIASNVAALQDLVPVGASISNQLVTKSEASVDSALSSTSEHAVQNKVVKAAIDAKQDSLTFDNVPTENSANVVKSGGVYSAVDDVYKVMGQNGGGKNLNIYPYHETTETKNGITFTDNGDGTITANGTSTAVAQFFCHLRTNTSTEQNNLIVPNGTYIISGCPSDINGAAVIVANITENGVSTNKGTDRGNGDTFTVDGDDYYDDRVDLGILIYVYSGKTLDNVTFRPMLRLASDTDDTWQPYIPTNEELSERIINVYKTMGQNGAKNLIPYPPYTNTHLTHRGITFDVNEDGSVNFEGTGTDSNPALMGIVEGTMILPAGSYTLSGGTNLYGGVDVYFFDDSKCTEDYSGTYTGLVLNNNYVHISTVQNGAYFNQNNLYGCEKTFTIDQQAYIRVQIRSVNNSYTSEVSGTVYPMLRLASDIDNTWQPYAKTNLQLTEDKAEESAVFNVYGAKNLIPYPYYQTTQTYSGITTTDNGDGTLTFDGTSTANSVIFRLTNNNSSTIKIPLNASNYVLTWVDSDQHSPYFRVDIGLMKSDGTTEVKNGESGITYINNTAGTYTGVFAISVYTFTNQTVSDLTFYPMLRLANVKDSTWTPYTMTNKQLTQKIVNTYQFVEDTVISTTSGSYATCMTDVVDLLTAYQATCDSNEFFKIQNVSCGGLQMSQQIPFDIWPTTDFSSSALVFSSTVIHANDLQIFALRNNVTDGLHRYTLDNTTLNWSHYVFNSTSEITIAIRVYKYRKV